MATLGHSFADCAPISQHLFQIGSSHFSCHGASRLYHSGRRYPRWNRARSINSYFCWKEREGRIRLQLCACAREERGWLSTYCSARCVCNWGAHRCVWGPGFYVASAPLSENCRYIQTLDQAERSLFLTSWSDYSWLRVFLRCHPKNGPNRFRFKSQKVISLSLISTIHDP